MESRFDELTSAWVRSYVSKAAEMPYQTAYYWRSKTVARPDGLNRDMILEALQTWDNISLDTSLAMVRDMFLNNDLALEFIIAGNVDHEKTLDLVRNLTEKTKTLTKGRNFTSTEDPRYHVFSRVLRLPENKISENQAVKNPKILSPNTRNYTCYRLQTNNTIQDNNAIFFSYELEPYSKEAYLRANILSQMLSKSVFFVLRTQKQLGYIVSSGIKTDYAAMLNFYVIIQSTYPLDQIELEITELMNGELRNLMNSSLKDNFLKYQYAVRNKIKNSYKNNTMENTVDLYWSQVSSKQLNFEAKKEKLALVEKITFEEIHDLYEKMLVSSNGEAKILSAWTHGVKSEFPEARFDCQNIDSYKYRKLED